MLMYVGMVGSALQPLGRDPAHQQTANWADELRLLRLRSIRGSVSSWKPAWAGGCALKLLASAQEKQIMFAHVPALGGAITGV